MFATSKKLTASIVLVVFLSMVLLDSVLVAGSDARERNHKAMTFGRAKMKNEATTTAIVANEDPEQAGHEDGDDEADHNNNEHGDFDGDDVDDVDDEDDGENEENRVTAGPSKLAQVTTPSGVNYVATTPSIIAKSPKIQSRYEQGLEDYDEAAARVEQEKKQQTVQQYNSMVQPFLTMFNVINSALSYGRSTNAAGLNPATLLQLAGWGTTGSVVGNSVRNRSGKESTGENVDSGAGAENSTALAAVEGRYIKGDPLNGYYDFIISEGSYKFWAVFQVITAVLIIYSTFAAIYYSKVSPLTSDYDYIDYLNGGRSFAGGRPASGRSDSLVDTWDRLLHKPWFNVVTRSFGFIMDAIERVPQ